MVVNNRSITSNSCTIHPYCKLNLPCQIHIIIQLFWRIQGFCVSWILIYIYNLIFINRVTYVLERIRNWKFSNNYFYQIIWKAIQTNDSNYECFHKIHNMLLKLVLETIFTRNILKRGNILRSDNKRWWHVITLHGSGNT